MDRESRGEVGSPRVQLGAKAGSANSQEQDKGPQEGATTNTSGHPSLTINKYLLSRDSGARLPGVRGQGPAESLAAPFAVPVTSDLPCASVSSTVKWDRPSLTSQRRPAN